jgi:hypothetical protein
MKKWHYLALAGLTLALGTQAADLAYPPESAFKRIVLAENPKKDP